MKKTCFLFLFTICFISTCFSQDFSVSLQVKTNAISDNFPSISTNKQWDDAPVIDLISTSNMGLTLESGKNAGWSIFMQPNGAWGWNIGDGENRLDYLPTTKQQINDGDYHEIAISFYFNKKTAWLYFDNKHVAIYSLSELNLSQDMFTQNIKFNASSEIKIKKKSLGKITINAGNSYASTAPDKLTVMAWNIWHGARHNGNEKGIDQAIIDNLLSDDSGDDDELERARKAAIYKLKLLKSEKDLRKRKEKLFRFLQGRGFSAGVIFTIIDKVL